MNFKILYNYTFTKISILGCSQSDTAQPDLKQQFVYYTVLLLLLLFCYYMRVEPTTLS